MPSPKVSFREEQTLHPALKAVGGGSFIFILYGMYVMITEQQEDVWIMTAVLIFSLILMLWLLAFELKTYINSNGITAQIWPFKKEFQWSQIEELEVINFGFIGGWGIRHFTKYGTVYNARGKKGLRIKLKNGKKFLIGTQKEEELKNVIGQWEKLK